MRKTFIGATIIACLVISYFLFEPVFAWAFGWQPLPEVAALGPNTAVQDAAFLSAISKSQKLLSASHALSQSPAVSIAVGMDNKVVWAEARGYRDVQNKIMADTHTRFRIGSVSKAVTSVGLGRLLEKGKLSLDDSVGQYVSYFDHPEITIRQLASHVSGIRNYGLCFCFPIWEYYNLEAQHSIEESVTVFNGDPLLFKPGTSFSYSSYNYTLLSGIMEKASEKNFLAFMKDEVFEPIGIHHTSGDYADSLMENRASSYELSNGEYKEAFRVDNSNKWAGGGLVSTPSDLVKMGNALLSDTFLHKETLDTLFTPQLLADGSINPQNYALGWRHDTFELFEGEKSVQVIHHGGTALGATALLVLIPEYELSIAMIINKSEKSFTLFDDVIPIAEQFISQSQEPYTRP